MNAADNDDDDLDDIDDGDEQSLCEDGDEKDWLSDSSVKPGRASPIEPFKIGAAQSAQSAWYHPGQLGPTVFGAIVHNRAEQNMIASST